MNTNDEIRELEVMLKHIIRPEMTTEEKLKALADSYWRAHNAGYNDYMAGQLMGGISNWETDRWELDCKYKYEVDRLYELLKEQE
ncbi:MAG: hypothetical protein E7589_06255 [Ruminococcaceae bacterium]|nr:hypothetical protein [Oscillospiraceae bacterium]